MIDSHFNDGSRFMCRYLKPEGLQTVLQQDFFELNNREGIAKLLLRHGAVHCTLLLDAAVVTAKGHGKPERVLTPIILRLPFLGPYSRMLRFLPLISMMNFGDDDTAQLSAHAKVPLRSLFFNQPVVRFFVPTELLSTY